MREMINCKLVVFLTDGKMNQDLISKVFLIGVQLFDIRIVVVYLDNLFLNFHQTMSLYANFKIYA